MVWYTANCQIGRQLVSDRAQTIANYIHALSLGQTEPLPTLFRTCGVTFPFGDEVVTQHWSLSACSWQKP